MALTANKNKSKINFSEEIDKTINKKNDENDTMKKKAGRPASGPVKKISLSIPEELYAGVETGAALFFKGNKTAYINALIRKDLEQNGDKYKEFKQLLK